ncbi:MAG: hypothetical protein J6D28_04830 [Bacilli bacterium]|nr:hypothetical protein [Bacilli bacterium]
MNKELSIKQNMLYNSIGKVLYLFFQWLTTVVIVKIAGFSDAGVLALAISITSTIYSISAFGMRNYQSSDINNKFSYGDYFNSRIFTCIISLFICFLFLLFTNYSFNVKLCIFAYMIFRISEAIVDVLHGEEQKIWRMDIIGKSFIIRGFIMFLSYFITLYVTKNLLYAILTMDVLLFISVYFYDFKKFGNLIGHLKKFDKNFFPLIVVCLPLAVYTLCNNAVTFFPKFFLERHYGTEILGIYSSIASPLCIVQTSASLLFDPLVTLFAEYFNKGDIKAFTKLLFRVSLIIIGILIFGLVGIILFGKPVFTILYNKEILNYFYVVYQVLFTTILTAFVWFLCTILIVIRKIKILMYSSIISLIINAILSCVLVPRFGLSGVTMVLIITLIIQALCATLSCYIGLRERK